MRMTEIARMKIESETEGLGYVLAALFEAHPTNVEELSFFLQKISRELGELRHPGPRDAAAREAANSLYRGIEAFKYRESSQGQADDDW